MVVPPVTVAHSRGVKTSGSMKGGKTGGRSDARLVSNATLRPPVRRLPSTDAPAIQQAGHKGRYALAHGARFEGRTWGFITQPPTEDGQPGAAALS
ncbi:hypothetical protein ASD64_15270 [Mesorhizobium sp. Root157]|nr:hypothetical protein ASD64_15270 [Mesorhizobium sp. Root157]